MKKLLLVTIVLFALISCSKNDSKQLGHTCNYPSCPFKTQTSWQQKGCGACEKASDCYTLDSLHFIYPTKSYEQLDSMLIAPNINNEPKFCDGEGNEIAIKDVQLLVRSQFVLMTKEQKIHLKEVFEQ